MVSAQETTTEPSASLAILPVSIEICVDPIWAVTLCCMTAFLLDWANPRPVTLIVGFNPAAAGLKPLIKVEHRPERRFTYFTEFVRPKGRTKDERNQRQTRGG